MGHPPHRLGDGESVANDRCSVGWSLIVASLLHRGAATLFLRDNLHRTEMAIALLTRTFMSFDLLRYVEGEMIINTLK